MRKQGTDTQIGRRLQAVRATREFSQGTVARIAGVAPSYLSRVENGKVQPTFPTLLRIMRALHADFAELLGPEGTTESQHAGCPVSRSGQCLLDVLRSDQEVARDATRTLYSAREVRLLRRVAAWIKVAPPERLQAFAVVLDVLTGETPL